jgi:CheY-like chemotaxis protein
MFVVDTGSGIPPEIQSKVFDPFFTTKPPGQGTGLGLAQVYGIVAEHGGVVDLVSTLDSGTAVQIFLPLSDSSDARPQTVERSERTVADDRCRILLVEDQKVLSDLLCRQLELLGHTVATASNGEEALSWLAQNEAPEIVLCDVVMPLKGGREVLREIRKRGLDTRVILMSGNPGQDDHDREVEPDGWLNKPFRTEQLASMIETLLSTEAASH